MRRTSLVKRLVLVTAVAALAASAAPASGIAMASPEGASAPLESPEGGSLLAEGPVVIGETSYQSLSDAVSAVPADGTQTTITLTADLEASEPAQVNAGQVITLNMNGHTITVTSDFTGRVLHNYGTLTITGTGTMDVTNSHSTGYGAVNNFGTLTVVDGTYKSDPATNASIFYNRSGGTATFESPTVVGGAGSVATEKDTTTTISGGYYEDPYYPAIENRGDMTITGGEFVNTSCSSCDKSKWGYTIRSGEKSDGAYLKIQGPSPDSVKVTGVQGGLAVVGGTADVYNGVYKTVPCKVHSDGNSAFYAGYFTGESYKTAVNVYGGSFASCTKTAVLVGNGNPAPDSGAGESSTVMISGGTFVGGDPARTAVTVNNEQHAIGAASVSGGSFSSDPKAYMSFSSSLYTVKSDDMYTVYSSADAVSPSVDPDGTASVVVDTVVPHDGSVSIDVTATDQPVTKAEVSLPAGQLAGVAQAEVKTPVGTVSFDEGAVAAIAGASGNVTLAVTQGPALNDAQAAATQDAALVVDLSLVDESGRRVEFDEGSASVTVALDRQPAKGEKVVVYYVDDEGVAHPCETTLNEDGTVTFVTSHFSVYSVAFEPDPSSGDGEQGDGSGSDSEQGDGSHGESDGKPDQGEGDSGQDGDHDDSGSDDDGGQNGLEPNDGNGQGNGGQGGNDGAGEGAESEQAPGSAAGPQGQGDGTQLPATGDASASPALMGLLALVAGAAVAMSRRIDGSARD